MAEKTVEYPLEICAICLETITDPYCLECCHLFCTPCITNWCNYTRPSSCPVCRVIITPSNFDPEPPIVSFVQFLEQLLRQRRTFETLAHLLAAYNEVVQEDGNLENDFVYNTFHNASRSLPIHLDARSLSMNISQRPLVSRNVLPSDSPLETLTQWDEGESSLDENTSVPLSSNEEEDICTISYSTSLPGREEIIERDERDNGNERDEDNEKSSRDENDDRSKGNEKNGKDVKDERNEEDKRDDTDENNEREE